MEEKDIVNFTQLMQVSADLSVYRQTLAYALGNLVIMTIISSSLIIVQSFFEPYWIVFLIFWVIVSIGAVFLHLFVYRHVLRRIRMGLWVIAYPAIIIFGYVINFLLGNPISTYFLWFPLLGFGSLAIGITSEQKHFSNDMLFARPILLLGLALVFFSPIVLLVLLLQPGEPNIFITPGIALILASLSTSYSMYQAEKKVVTK
ncbi:MAG: hypothetical protein JSW11_11870 [Candidatus Heimdallarchaeota archaeon]|nr:MAG: hypothetical protein JSW11_11870 [Candidatus Heimdallarchaeota archaeon]